METVNIPVPPRDAMEGRSRLVIGALVVLFKDVGRELGDRALNAEIQCRVSTETKSLMPCFKKSFSFSRGIVPETDTGGQFEKTKALENLGEGTSNGTVTSGEGAPVTMMDKCKHCWSK